MRIPAISDEQLYDLIRFGLDHGIDFFDLADIYGGGEAERKVGRVLQAHPGLRDEMFVQSKVSIRGGFGGNYYDLSYAHIKEGVDEILGRLGLASLDSKWDLNQYAIAYVLDGGSNSASNPSSYS